MAYDFSRSLNDVLAGMQQDDGTYVDPTTGKRYKTNAFSGYTAGGSEGADTPWSRTELYEDGAYGGTGYQYDNIGGGFLGDFTTQNPNAGGGLWDTVGKGFVVPAAMMAAGAGAFGGTGVPGVGDAGWGADLGTSMGAFEGAAGASGAAGGSGGWLSTLTGGKGLGGLGGLVGTAAKALGGDGGMNFGGLAALAGGAYDMYQQGRASDKLLDYVSGAQKKVDQIYAPGGEYQKYMWDAMSAKDAASGRNSQYGPRTQGFMGQYAKDYAGATSDITKGLSGTFSSGVNQGATASQPFQAGIGNLLGGGGNLGSVIQNMSSYLNNNSNTYNPQTMSGGWAGTSNAPFFYGNGSAVD